MKRYIRSNDFLSDEDKEILRNADTSDWSAMQDEYVEDRIRDAGSYEEYIRREKSIMSSEARAKAKEDNPSYRYYVLEDLGDGEYELCAWYDNYRKAKQEADFLRKKGHSITIRDNSQPGTVYKYGFKVWIEDQADSEVSGSSNNYVRSSYTFDPWENADPDNWSDNDIEIYNSIDWKSRNYMPYEVSDDTFKGHLNMYGIDGDIVRIPVTFVKQISANTIYPPSYRVKDFDQISDKYSDMGYMIVSPMFDGTYHNIDGVDYKVMDRCETQDMYDRLSR